MTTTAFTSPCRVRSTQHFGSLQCINNSCMFYLPRNTRYQTLQYTKLNEQVSTCNVVYTQRQVSGRPTHLHWVGDTHPNTGQCGHLSIIRRIYTRRCIFFRKNTEILDSAMLTAWAVFAPNRKCTWHPSPKFYSRQKVRHFDVIEGLPAWTRCVHLLRSYCRYDICILHKNGNSFESYLAVAGTQL